MKLKKPTKGNVLAAGTLALLLSIGAGSAIGLGYYKTSVRAYERTNFKFTLPEGEVKPIAIDMSGHGLPKQILQPNSIRLRSRSIKNTGEDPLPLMIAFEGIPGTLAVKSSGAAFDPATQLKVLNPGEKWKFDIYIHLPPEFRDDAIPINGQMLVTSATDHTTLATVPISIFWGDE